MTRGEPGPATVDVPSSEATDVARSPYRWVILLCCWLAFTMTYVNRSAWPVVSTDAAHALGIHLAALGVFATALTVGYILSNIPGGIVADLLGGRYGVTFSLAGVGVLTFAFGWTSSVTTGIVIQAATGLVSGADLTGCSKLISGWFSRADRATAFGLFITSTAVGSVIANATVPALLPGLGWRGVFRLFGVVTVVVALVCYLLLRDARRPGRRAKPLDLRPLLANRALLFVALAGFGMQWGTLGLLAWANALMIRGLGFSLASAAAVMVIVSSAGIVVKPVIGFVSDRLGNGRRSHIMVLSAFFALILVAFGFVGNHLAALWLAPLLGVGVYGYTPLTNTIVAEVSAPERLAASVGAVNTVWQTGGAFAPLAVGAAFAATGSLEVAFLVLAAGPLIGVALMLPVRERGSQPNGDSSHA